MNVIVANKYQAMLSGLDVDVIKTMYGEFDVDEIIATFQNFFFQRMILDVTAIKGFQDIKNLQKLSISLDMDKVILLLDDSAEGTSSDYLSKLISMGIYNFTKNIEGIMYLYNNPNSYRDVAHIQQLDPIIETVVQYAPNPNEGQATVNSSGPRVIGVKNVTKASGATTLVYMMKKQLEKNYSVRAIEVDKRDFGFFPDKELVTTTNSEVGNTIAKYHDVDVILLDLNNSESAEKLCQDVIYLIEPSVIKLNKLMLIDPKAMLKLKNKKVILNQSLLSAKDVLDFEYEARIKTFFNMPPLDDRESEVHILNTFLTRLGFERQNAGETVKKNGILGLFNR